MRDLARDASAAALTGYIQGMMNVGAVPGCHIETLKQLIDETKAAHDLGQPTVTVGDHTPEPV